MGGETANTARMAELLSTEIMSEFFWNSTGGRNINWACERPDKHERKTHPSDCVFFYDEPYSKRRTYVNCDLKSYAAGSITTSAIKKAIESLAISLQCLEQSLPWQEMYMHAGVPSNVCGLLFVYNHDGAYDTAFANVLRTVGPMLDIPKGSKIVVLGPQDVFWLDNICHDLTLLRGKTILPLDQSYKFYYPHLIQSNNLRVTDRQPATLEQLSAPWITVESSSTNSTGKTYIVYYKRPGETTEEFLYLLDWLMHFQIIKPGNNVRVKTIDAHVNAPMKFGQAVDLYVDKKGAPQIKTLLDSVEFGQIAQIKSIFSDVAIGMEDR